MSDSDKTMSSGDNEQQALGHVKSWGRQTVAFAMSLRAHEIGKPADDPDRARLACIEATKTTDDLWNEALNECRKPLELPEMAMQFTKRVFDWACKHRED